MSLRSVICTVMGHVDHGKSSILDKIRGTAIVKSEPGQITQAIGASIIPLKTVRTVCGELLDAVNTTFTIPGLLFIDTPGHEAFTHLRKRGGNIADIAIVVVDINEGFRPQTIEAIDILRHSKTPFVLAANKVDLIPGWKSGTGGIIGAIAAQQPQVQQAFETLLYTLVGSLSEKEFEAERFDRVSDYTRQVAIVPCSAKTGEGIPELLMVIAGLAQRYLEASLSFDPHGAARGTILEVKKDKGLGTTLDVILYDGSLKRGDTLVIGTLDEPLTTKVKALFEPAELSEMRDRKSKFKPVTQVHAATGVKISAPGIESAVAGMPVISAPKADDVANAVNEIRAEVSDVLIETDEKGIIIKADSLGSLEALISLLRDKGITIRRASIGNVTRKDLAEAESNFERDPLSAALLAFNVEQTADAASARDGMHVAVFINNVIYRLLEDFEQWRIRMTKEKEAHQLDLLIRPAKVQLMRGYVFRQSNPAIVGVDVLGGTLRTGTSLMKHGKAVGLVKGIQHEKQNITSADQGMRVAVSLDGATVGRQIAEGDILYAVIPEPDFRRLKDLREYLRETEVLVLKEVALQMRKENPMWGV